MLARHALTLVAAAVLEVAAVRAADAQAPAIRTSSSRRVDPPQAKVYGIHSIVLKPGVTGEQFERFFADRALPAWKLPGVAMTLVKGDRGDRDGGYAVVFEIESRSLRDRYFPQAGAQAPEVQRAFQSLQPIFDEWRKLATLPGETTVYTDYRLVAR